MSRIELGDTLELIKNIPDESIDLVCSDIPYKIATGGCAIKEREHEYGGILNRRYVDNELKSKWLKQNDDAILIRKGKFFDNIPLFSEWLPDVYRVLKNNTHCYLMINSRNLKELQVEAEKVGFKFQNLLVWVKNNATPNRYYMQSCEFILMLRKGAAKDINCLGTSNVFSYPNIIGNKYHPTEKNVDLMKDLILNSTNENDIVLDPFMGSGTTCLACKETNRHYVGFEIDKKYYDIARKRLSNIYVPRIKSEQISLF